jgi:DNA-binding NtrC family response regulator
MYDKDPVKIFVVEDDPAYTKFLKYVLELNPDYDLEFFTSGKDCLANLYKNPAVITLDYSLPDLPGEKVLSQIKSHDPNIGVIIVSAQEKIHTAVELLKLGAFDYISKDHETKDRLLNSINNARNKTSLIKEIDHLKKEISVTNSKRALSVRAPLSNVSFRYLKKLVRRISRLVSLAKQERVRSLSQKRFITIRKERTNLLWQLTSLQFLVI